MNKDFNIQSHEIEFPEPHMGKKESAKAMINTSPREIYFCYCSTDGTPWSYTGTLGQIIKRLARDAEMEESEMLEWALKSKHDVKEDRGHMTTERFHIHGEQWEAAIYRVTGRHDEDMPENLENERKEKIERIEALCKDLGYSYNINGGHYVDAQETED